MTDIADLATLAPDSPEAGPFRLLVDGALVDGAASMAVVNPATGRPFCTVPRADAAQLETAIAAARRAQPAWARTSYAERGALIGALADAVEARIDDFARLITLEQGKLLGHARGEVRTTVALLRHAAGQELKPEILREGDGTRIIEKRTPRGVVAAIAPWNFPLFIMAQKVGPALITGNAVICKPAPTTPTSALLLGEVAAEILPAGVLQTIVDQNDLGAILSSHKGIDFVSFTGSSPTGKKVLGSSVDTMKRVSLELGGNDAALLLDDADVATVAPRLFAGFTNNSGQICLATKRVYAPSGMVDELCDALAGLAAQAVTGDGLQQGTTMGPISNKAQYEKVLDLIEDARAQGTLVAGGEALPGEGYFIPPTIFRDLPEDSRLVQEEQFGPVLPVQGYDDLDEAIERINASDYGLGGVVWTSDVDRGIDVAGRIVSGTVWVNRQFDLPFDVPFGGARHSGLGRQHGAEGLKEFTQATIINASI
ncbi:aldehyde dehydrogenase family protein [Sphingobium sp. Sx8-8]|uniref:aldehyde dehydrogenase family protein n=1 Tax=Sphingobium sp. Sx8-8 TaxID=2933617 RepID=UPI001F588FC2|nr:aldehyde dehydrogenase family protein [Sphingobium sp. Sx8-8]